MARAQPVAGRALQFSKRCAGKSRTCSAASAGGRIPVVPSRSHRMSGDARSSGYGPGPRA
jgi:hypothetical protein